jgi:hypothetical protein
LVTAGPTIVGEPQRQLIRASRTEKKPMTGSRDGNVIVDDNRVIDA